jgi:2',3'-cyclic-nucleotide 2'-phosphodiesterase/3'-nucleotidase
MIDALEFHLAKKIAPRAESVKRSGTVQVSPPDRRRFLRLLGGATGALLLPSCSRAAPSHPSDVVWLSLFHTTDLHGHIVPTIDYDGQPDLGGLARCATQIGLWRSENPNSLLIDVGDVYQGTQFALSDEGRTMIELFNLLRYDAWIVGNHEFDWGMEPFLRAVAQSKMPVLAANIVPAGRGDPLTRIQPFILREIAGIRLAVIGLTTPGMPFWFLPSFTKGLEFRDPVDAARRAVREAKSLGADVIVLAGHMGLKDQTGGDDFANRAVSLTAEFPEASVYIAGHTHQAIESRLTNGVILTQADHFGIHLGRVDLFFDRNSKKLLHQEAHIERMDDRIALDPMILGRTSAQRGRAAKFLHEPIGELVDTLSAKARPGVPSAIELLIAAAIGEALREHGLAIDGVFHGLFNDHAFRKGPKTTADLWTILPYENFLVTANLDAVALRVIMNETFEIREDYSLTGFRFEVTGEQNFRRLTNFRLADGRPLDPTRRYRIAMNSFDASSGGHRFMKLREIVARPEAGLTFHPVQTRDALIDYFHRHKRVSRFRILDRVTTSDPVETFTATA